VRVDTRWATSNAAGIRKHAAELAALAPDVILAHGASTVGPLLQATRTVPIVSPVLGDPVGAGFADSLARPGGNITGFMSWEYGIGWRPCQPSRGRPFFGTLHRARERVSLPPSRPLRRH
jgi:putative ABC transport system substrate-binding protein